jgi:diguanylate cyclase (GGDEF)-like protein/PAS domain S-box-containing protein
MRQPADAVTPYFADATLRAISEATSEGLLVADERGRIELFNPAAQIIFGYTAEEVLGRHIDLLVPSRHRGPHWDAIRAYLGDEGAPAAARSSREVPGRRRDGTEIPLRVAFHRYSAAGRLYLLALVQDLTDDRRTQAELSYLSRHDALTGLLNRKAFEQRLDDLLSEEPPPDAPYALVLIDIDQFRLVNDTCGPPAGDALLKQVSMLVRSRLRHADTVARLGGDEFGAVLRDIDPAELSETAESLLYTVRNFLFAWESRSFDISVSMGLAAFAPGADTPQSVLSAAHLACREAKALGGNRLHVYSPGDLGLARRRGDMHRVADISSAIDDERFRLYAQPIVPLRAGGGTNHYEVLVRMVGTDGAPIGPEDFIPAAERYVLMPSVDRWILNRLLTTQGEAMRRLAGTDAGFLYAVNLSGCSLGEEGFLNYVIRQFEERGVPFSTVCFEITETAAIANLDAARMTMEELRARGSCVALDDFGSGLSSFRYLKTLPLDYLKIDGSLVRNLARDPRDLAMVRAINEVGHAMGLRTVAEWVEDPLCLARVKEIGVDYAQGYAIGEPSLIDTRLAASEPTA